MDMVMSLQYVAETSYRWFGNGVVRCHFDHAYILVVVGIPF